MKRVHYAEITSALDAIVRGCRSLNKLISTLGPTRDDQRLNETLKTIGLSGLQEIKSAAKRIEPALDEEKQYWLARRRYKADAFRKTREYPVARLIFQCFVLLEEIKDGAIDPDDSILSRSAFNEMREEIENLPPLEPKHLKKWAMVMRDFIWKVRPYLQGMGNYLGPEGQVYQAILKEAEGEASRRKAGRSQDFKAHYGVAPMELIRRAELDPMSLDSLLVRHRRKAAHLLGDVSAVASTRAIMKARSIVAMKVDEGDLKEALRSTILNKLGAILETRP